MNATDMRADKTAIGVITLAELAAKEEVHQFQERAARLLDRGQVHEHELASSPAPDARVPRVACLTPGGGRM
jgi:hypothetical protein